MNMRIGGLASGIDTEQIIKDIIRAERIPIDKMKQKQQTLEWQRDDYRAINTTLLNFSQKLFDMRLTTYYRAKTTSSTNEGLVTAVAGNRAGNTSYTISEVKQLATAARKISSGSISQTEKNNIDINKGIFSQQTAFAGTVTGDVNESFGWETGIVETETIHVKKEQAGKQFSLQLQPGSKVVDLERMSIKVNGKAFTVVQEGQEPPAGAKNVVTVTETGELKFKNKIDANSTIQVDYIADQRVVDRSITNNTTTINLGKSSIAADSVSVQVGETTYTAKKNVDTGVYHLISTDGAEEDLGTINLETGTITVHKAFTENIAEEESLDFTAAFQQNYFSFGITTETSEGIVQERFHIGGGETFTQVIDKVNKSAAGVTMFYDSFTGKISMTRSETGRFHEGTMVNTDDAYEQITTSGGFLNEILKFGNVNETGGQNAKFTINGLETERSTNSFTMSDVTFTLKKTFDNENVQININNDSEKIFDNIVKFVDEYNKVIDEIQNKLQEERFKDYPPLTDEQREELSDRQQELWEEKSKSGLLRRDSMLTGALADMRMSLYSPVDNPELSGMLNQLAQMGIKTTTNYMDGKLEINEDKLREVINKNPEQVEKLFIGDGETFGQKGIIRRLSENVDRTREKIRVKAGSATSVNHQFTIGKELEDIKNRIERFEMRVQQVETRYWRQFTAMERAIQRANQQSEYLMQQFMM